MDRFTYVDITRKDGRIFMAVRDAVDTEFDEESDVRILTEDDLRELAIQAAAALGMTLQ